jgi:hypothetical protein
MPRRVVRTVLIVAGIITGGTLIARRHHWSLVVPVRPATLSEENREFARAHHDLPVP